MQLFNLGKVVTTMGVHEMMKEDPLFDFIVQKALAMHSEGNWGDVCDEDWKSNQEALNNGGRLFSSYYTSDDKTEKIWIITEGDRSVTTVLFPDEY